MAAEIRRHIEQYQDMIARLFPPTQEMIDGAGDRRILSRVLTFQVTDACNLGCDYCYQINLLYLKFRFHQSPLQQIFYNNFLPVPFLFLVLPNTLSF